MSTTTSRHPRRRATRPAPPIALHVLLYPDDGVITAICLETGLASCERKPADATRQFDDAAQALFAAVAADRNAASPFERPAPSSHWRALRHAKLTDASDLALDGFGRVTRLAYLADESPDA